MSFIRFLLGLALWLTPVITYAQATQSFVTTFTNASQRNNYSGFVGMQFTTGASPVTVTALGRMNAQGLSSGVHTVKLVDASTALDLPGGTVQLTLLPSSGGSVFNYANLAAPVVLQPNKAYRLLSQEKVSGDFWFDLAPVTTTTVATVNGSVYTDAGGSQVFLTGTAGLSYVPVSFLYSTSSTNPPPTVTITAPVSGTQSPTAFTAQATPELGNVASVQFVLNAQNYGPPVTVSTSPGVYSVSVPAGSLLVGVTYSLTAVVTDTFGYSATSAPVSFTEPNGDGLFLTAQTLGTLRNNYGDATGHFVGMEITITDSAEWIYQLGRFVAPGNSQPHLLKLVDASTGTDVPGASVTVSLAGATPGTYVYGYLLNPVLLPADTSYYLVSQEMLGSDSWYDFAPVTSGFLGTVVGAVYQADNGVFQVVPNSAGYSYVPVNLGGAAIFGSYNPAANLLLPPNSTVSGLATLSATVTTGYLKWPIQEVYFIVDGVPLGPPAVPGTPFFGVRYGGTYQGTIDTTRLANGPHTLAVTVTDYIHDTATSTVESFLVSNAGAGAIPQSLVGKVQGTYLRNNFSGFVGMQITLTSPLSVSSLGRYCVSGNTGTHIVKLVQGLTNLDLPGGSTTVSMANCTPGQFVYAPLPSTLTLSAGGSYYLVSLETSGQDQWFDFSPVTVSAGVTVNGPAYSPGQGWVTVPAPGSSYVPVSFLNVPTGGNGLLVTQTLSGQVVTATAVSNGKLLGVQFQIDGFNIYSEVMTAPYQLTIPSLSYGTHQITATAYDSLGNSAVSEPLEYDSGCNPCLYFDGTYYRVQTPIPVVQFTPTQARNNYTGWVGFGFTTSNLQFLGFPGLLEVTCAAGDNQSHLIRLVNASTGIDVPNSAMWINFAQGCNLIGFPANLLLPATSYYLVMQVTAGGDTWFDVSPAVPTPYNGGGSTSISTPFVINGPVYWNGSQFVLVPLPNYSFVGFEFAGYSIPI